MRKFQGNRVRNGEVIRVFRQAYSASFRSSHLKIFQIFYKVSLFLQAFKMMTRRGEKKLWRVERSLRPLLVEKNRNANIFSDTFID